MTAEEVEPTWAMVAALLLHRMSSSLLSFDFAGEAHDVYFGGASNFGLISTSKLLKRFDQSRFKSRVPYETNMGASGKASRVRIPQLSQDHSLKT